jgi:hypothetical protein
MGSILPAGSAHVGLLVRAVGSFGIKGSEELARHFQSFSCA